MADVYKWFPMHFDQQFMLLVAKSSRVCTANLDFQKYGGSESWKCNGTKRKNLQSGYHKHLEPATYLLDSHPKFVLHGIYQCSLEHCSFSLYEESVDCIWGIDTQLSPLSDLLGSWSSRKFLSHILDWSKYESHSGNSRRLSVSWNNKH